MSILDRRKLDNSFRYDIQSLRGLAVIYVVLYHANSNIVKGGFLGVDIFFVISGFVVTPLILRIFAADSYSQLRRNISNFYKRRFYRLFPALVFTLILSAPLLFLFASPDVHKNISKQIIYTTLLIANYGTYRLNNNYFDPTPSPLIHTWSLSVEEQIYLILPLVTLLIYLVVKSFRRAIVIVWGLLFVFSFTIFLNPQFLLPIYNKTAVIHVESFIFYSPFSRIWEFLVGSFCYGLNKVIFRHKLTFLNYLLALALVALPFLHISLNLTFGPVATVIVTALVIINRSFETIKVLPKKPLQWIGDRSYAIYLLHMPILWVVNYSRVFYIRNKVFHMLFDSLTLVLILLLSNLLHNKIENKFRVLGKKSNSTSNKDFKTFIYFVISPLLIGVLMWTGSANSYGGILKSTVKPPYAGDLDKNCQRDTFDGQPCIYGQNKSSKSILLIGDSHAGMLSEAFVQAAVQVKFRAIVWTHSGCRFSLYHYENYDSHCYLISQDIYHYVKVNKPDAIFISQYITSSEPLHILEKSIDSLRKYSERIFIVGNTPVFPDEQDFMKARPLIMPRYLAPKYFNISEMNQEQFTISKKLKVWAELNRLNFIDLNDLYCNLQNCIRWSQKGWLFRDSDHLSVEGASLSNNLFKSAILTLKDS